MLNKKLLMWIVLIAIGLRIISTLALHFHSNIEDKFEDARCYHNFAMRLAAYWENDNTNVKIDDVGWTDIKKYVNYKFFYYYIAVVYYLFGPIMLIPKLINAILGGLVPLLIFRIARYISKDTLAALIASGISAFFPSQILWSSVLLKITPIIFFTSLCILAVLRFREKLKWGYLLLFLFSLLVLYGLQFFSALILFVLCAYSFFIPAVLKKDIPAFPRIFFRFTLFFIVTLLFIVCIRRRFPFFSPFHFGWLNTWRAPTVLGNAFCKDTVFMNIFDVLKFAPVGFAYFYFAPFPWAVFSLGMGYILPEMVLWYVIFMFALAGIFYALAGNRDRLASHFILLGYIFSIASVYSLLMANIGTLYIHRAQVAPFLFIFSAIAIRRILCKKTA